MKITFMKKTLVMGIIFFIYWTKYHTNVSNRQDMVFAHVDGDIDGVSPDAVTWDYASPQNSFIKWKVINLHVNSSKGNGSIIVKPIARPAVHYDFPEDFTTLRILFINNYLEGILFIPGVGDDYNFKCLGYGVLVEVNSR